MARPCVPDPIQKSAGNIHHHFQRNPESTGYVTGKKLDNKHYYHHTGWIGNLKDVKYRTLMNERPEFAMELAVKGMLPKNTIGRAAATRLKLYKGAEHNNAAQKPEAWTLD